MLAIDCTRRLRATKRQISKPMATFRVRPGRWGKFQSTTESAGCGSRDHSPVSVAAITFQTAQ